MESIQNKFRCPQPHRLVVEEKKTHVLFLIAPDAQVSLFPKFSITQKSKEKEESYVLVNSAGSIIPTYGKIIKKLDFGLGQEFTWKFTLVTNVRPIIGKDFLTHFRLKIDFNKMCLFNPETKIESMKISTAACECYRNEQSNDGWPPVTGIIERPMKHRFHVRDRITKMLFLVTRSSQISIFPKSELKEDVLEPFNDSFEIVGFSGEIYKVQGWTVKTLDFGTGRKFTWKFAVVESCNPIIGVDFLSQTRLVKQFRNGYFRLFDAVSKISTLAPTGPCDCGNGDDGWPSNTELTVRYVSKTKNQPNSALKSKLRFELPNRNARYFRNSFQSSRNSEFSNPIPGPSNQSPTNSQQKPLSFKRSFRSYKKKSNLFKEISKKNNDDVPKKTLEEDPQVRDENSHCFQVDDKNSKLTFLIGSSAQLSVLPKSAIGEMKMEAYDGYFELVGITGKVLQVLGWTTLTLDIGLKKEFTWRFAVIDSFDKPLLGEDFMGHFRLKINFQGLIDMETGRSTPLSRREYGKPQDGWPLISHLQIRRIASEENSKTVEEELVTEAKKQGLEEKKTSALSVSNESEIKHRFHITDKNTNLPFLIASTAEISVFPRSAVREEDMEPFNGSFELEGSLGETWQVLGWTTLNLDIGFLRNFTLKFAVIDIEKPILGLNFLSLYGLTICKEGLIDPETKMLTPTSSGPCDCDKPSDGWPTSTFLLIKPVSGKSTQVSESFNDEFEACEKFVYDSELREENIESVSDQVRKESENSKNNLVTSEKEFEDLNTYDGNLEAIAEDCNSTETTYEESEKNYESAEENSEKSLEYPESKEEKIGPVSDQLEHESKVPEEDSDSSDETSEASTEDSYTTVKSPEKDEEKYVENSQPEEEKIEEKSDASEEDTDVSDKNSEDSETFVEGLEFEEEAIENSLKIINKHRFHVMDKNSKILFFVSEMAQVSVFPISQIQRYTMENSKSSEFINSSISVLPIYGWVTFKLDFGLKREFEWKFAVSDFIKPIIGTDFLSQYGLQCNHTLEGSRLLDPESSMETPMPAGPCDCESSIYLSLSTNIRKSDLNSEMLPTQKKVEIEKHCKSATGGCCPEETRLILTERETGMPYFVSKASFSAFPKSMVKTEEIEAFDNSFNLINNMGSLVPIYGSITREMDFGLGRYFVWKFPVINISGPIVGEDFLQHYGLTISYSDRSAFDDVTAKTALGSKEFCECLAKKYWPDDSSMRKITINVKSKEESEN